MAIVDDFSWSINEQDKYPHFTALLIRSFEGKARMHTWALQEGTILYRNRFATGVKIV